MKQTIEKSWDLLGKTVQMMQSKIADIEFDDKAKSTYDANFRRLYELIQKEYMKNDVKNLDRHKVASIIIISILKSNAIVYKKEIRDDKRFFGEYLIAVSVGIAYMQDRLNSKLIDKGQNTITKIWLPDAISCDTPYFEILCRNLYYSENSSEWGLNPLELSEKLFILEYVTLEKNNIDPHILKEE